jgi:DNA-binding CsgD family transcriptional regulator
VKRFAAGNRLSPREREVLTHMAGGLQGKAIASILAISPSTVAVLRARLLKKAGCRSSAELLAALLVVATQPTKSSLPSRARKR